MDIEGESIIDLIKAAAIELQQGTPETQRALSQRINDALNGDSLVLLVRAKAKDWRQGAGESVPDNENQAYQFNLQTCLATNQVFIGYENVDQSALGAEISVEVNKGVPCLHVGNAVNGDTVAHIFCDKDGVSFVPDATQTCIQRIPSDRFYKGSNDVGFLFENQIEPHDGLLMC